MSRKKVSRIIQVDTDNDLLTVWRVRAKRERTVAPRYKVVSRIGQVPRSSYRVTYSSSLRGKYVVESGWVRKKADSRGQYVCFLAGWHGRVNRKVEVLK